MYKVFCLKELSGAITWNLLSGDNFLEGNYPGVIIQRTIMQAPISGAAFLLEAIVLGATIRRQLPWRTIASEAICLEAQLSRGIYPGGNYPGSNCPGGNCPRTGSG